MEPQEPTSHLDPDRSMKSLLADAVREAVKLALIDCVLADEVDRLAGEASAAFGGQGAEFDWVETAARLKAEWDQDIHAIPDRLFARMDPSALAGNVAVRLFGTGGWQLGKMYTGNATPRQVFEASIVRADRDSVGGVAMALAEELGGTVETDVGKVQCATGDHDWVAVPGSGGFDRCSRCGDMRPF